MTIHKAAPEDAYHAVEQPCNVCGLMVKRVYGGQGLTWIHVDSGAVAGTTTPVDEVIARWKAAAEKLESPRDENIYDPEGECRETIAETLRACIHELREAQRA